jgi:hypothetical protein
MHYRKYGLIGLTRDEREDSGSRRALSPTLREVVEALTLQKPPLRLWRCTGSIGCKTSETMIDPCRNPPYAKPDRHV